MLWDGFPPFSFPPYTGGKSRRDKGGQTLRTGPAGEVGEVYYLHGDHVGSTVMLTDQAGAAVERCGYDVYGEGPTPDLAMIYGLTFETFEFRANLFAQPRRSLG